MFNWHLCSLDNNLVAYYYFYYYFIIIKIPKVILGRKTPGYFVELEN